MSTSLQLHIWQLTEKTIVASVHVLVSRDTDYMAVADNIRKILHEYGVHSSTIQPEFAAETDDNSDNDVCCVSAFTAAVKLTRRSFRTMLALSGVRPRIVVAIRVARLSWSANWSTIVQTVTKDTRTKAVNRYVLRQ